MALSQFHKWYAGRHEYQKDWKKRTHQKIVGYFCTYTPEEIFYAFEVLPVRILGSHELEDLTEPHIFPMFCPFCRDILAQGLSGKYDYLDGIAFGQSCLHLQQAFTSWEIHQNPGWSHYLPMPNHVQSPRAIPFLKQEYGLLIRKLELLTGRTITDADLERGICIMNEVRQTMKQIYALRKHKNPPITGAQSMVMICSAFFTDAREWLPAAKKAIAELEERPPETGLFERDTGKRLLLVGSENDDMAFIEMVENLGETGAVGATIVVEEHCATTRYFWDEAQEGTPDPLTAIAQRYCTRTPCPSKDWPQRRRVEKIVELARAFKCDGALVIRQKFCDTHEADMPFVKKALEEAGIPTYFLEFDVVTPVGAFSIRVEEFLETLETEYDFFD
ncbi:MAG: 2-hydroxyacyl-CoA dehydratase [Proteobacteria bacterium]|nr:2-hydroxyacyl-CoA dehydratase [Pseudomonadota bacterium]